MKHLLPLLLLLVYTSLSAQVQFYGPSNPSSGGTTAQDFETAYDVYDAQGADDFIVPTGETWYIDSLLIPGSYSATAATTSGVKFFIYDDNNGLPGTQIYGDTISTNLDGNGDGDLKVVFETPLVLSSGHYWLVANARKDYANGGGQWYWQRDISNTGYPGLWRNPGNGFSTGCTSWTVMYECTVLGLVDSGYAFSLYGCYGPVKPLLEGFDTLLCAGAFNSVTLTGNTNGSQANVSYLWNTGDTSISITVSNSGLYTLYAVDSVTQCGNKAHYQIGIGSVPPPSIDDDTICGSSSIPATWGPVGGCPNCVTIWGDGSTGSFYSSSTPGMVTVTVLDTVSGCSSADTAYLEVISAEANINPGALIDLCEGSTVTVSVQETLINYNWAFSTNGSSWGSIGTSATATVNSGGAVAVSGTNSAGCQVFDTAQVILRPLPDPDIEFESQSSGNVELTASAGYNSYFWSDGSIGQSIVVTQNGIYTVTVTDEFGCEGTAFINVFTIGVEDVVARQVGVFPNPANDVINLVWPSHWLGQAKAALYDMQGRMLTSISASQLSQSLDASGLASGHYLLQIQSPDGIGKVAVVISH
jgi:hypothetical protein